MTEKRNKDRNVPTLRFPGFEGEWKEKRIGELLVIGSGKDYKHLQTGDIPVFGTGGYMTSVNKYLHDGETVCIGRKGTINKPFYYNGKIWTVDTLFYTHSFKNLIPRFCFNLFEKINWLHFNEASGVPSLSKSTIENIEVNIPEVSEQKKIAAFLKKIEERIETQNKIIEELKLLKSTLCNLLFSQQIKFNLNQGNDSNWKSLKLEDIFEALKGNGISKEKLTVTGINKCVLYGELYTKYSEVIEEIASKTNVSEGTKSKYGDLLIPSSTTTTGIDLANVSAILDNNVMLGGDITILRSKKEINSMFYAYYLTNYKKKELASYSQGSTIVHLYFNHFKETIIDFPEKVEQTKIAKMLFVIDNRRNCENEILVKYESQKKYLLSKLFT